MMCVERWVASETDVHSLWCSGSCLHVEPHTFIPFESVEPVIGICHRRHADEVVRSSPKMKPKRLFVSLAEVIVQVRDEDWKDRSTEAAVNLGSIPIDDGKPEGKEIVGNPVVVRAGAPGIGRHRHDLLDDA